MKLLPLLAVWSLLALACNHAANTFGAACETDSDCNADQQCVLQLSDTYKLTGGLCTTPCEIGPSEENKHQGEGYGCEPSEEQVCLINHKTLAQFCFELCFGEGDCSRPDWTCQFVGSGPIFACLPPPEDNQ